MAGVPLTTDHNEFARIPVDQGQTSFFEGREFRIIRKLVIPVDTPYILKFVAPVDFILFGQQLSCSVGDIEFFAWRDDNVTELTPFNTPVNIFRDNISDEYRYLPKGSGQRYQRQCDIFTGGSITVIDPQLYSDYDRTKTSNATARQISVGGAENTQRYLAAGTYYLQLSSLSGTSEGRYYIGWEERPDYTQAKYKNG